MHLNCSMSPMAWPWFLHEETKITQFCVETKITQYSIAYFDRIGREVEKGHAISAILPFSRRSMYVCILYILYG